VGPRPETEVGMFGSGAQLPRGDDHGFGVGTDPKLGELEVGAATLAAPAGPTGQVAGALAVPAGHRPIQGSGGLGRFGGVLGDIPGEVLVGHLAVAWGATTDWLAVDLGAPAHPTIGPACIAGR